MQDKIKQYFKNYPKSDVCYSTSDGFIFHEMHNAGAHGNTLKDTKVTPWRRGDIAAESSKVKGESGKKQKEPSERELLMAQYEELIGKKPAHNISNKKLKEAVSKALEEKEDNPSASEGPDGIEETKSETGTEQ